VASRAQGHGGLPDLYVRVLRFAIAYRVDWFLLVESA
jgi:hypothetical protein